MGTDPALSDTAVHTARTLDLVTPLQVSWEGKPLAVLVPPTPVRVLSGRFSLLDVCPYKYQ